MARDFDGGQKKKYKRYFTGSSTGAGKGDWRRDPQVSEEEFADNWARTFGGPKEEEVQEVEGISFVAGEGETSPFATAEANEAYSAGPDYWTRAYAEAKAERLGCTVEWSDDYTLQLDIDTEEAYQFFLQQFDLVNELGIFFWGGFEERRSRSGNRHITIKLDRPMRIVERILLQAVLGSDRKRDLLSFAGILNDQENPVLLFRPKL